MFKYKDSYKDMGSQPMKDGAHFNLNDVSSYLVDENCRVFLRFCKFSSSESEQMDCLPKSFNLLINCVAFQVKNKYTFAPYDITTRIACERYSEVNFRVQLDTNSNEAHETFYYALYLVKKVNHEALLEKFLKQPVYDIRASIELG